MRRGKLAPGPTVLTRESLMSRFASLLPAGGARFTGIVTAAGHTKIPAGMTVAASMQAPRQIFYVPKVELEHYDHGTRMVSQSDSVATRDAGDTSLTVRVPIPAAPMVEPGVRVGGGGERSWVDDPVSVSRATEHRAWLRRQVPGYHVYLPVQFTVTTTGADGQPTDHQVPDGSVEVVLTRQGAVQMGIPEAVLDQAVANQKANLPPADAGKAKPAKQVPAPEPVRAEELVDLVELVGREDGFLDRKIWVRSAAAAADPVNAGRWRRPPCRKDSSD